MADDKISISYRGRRYAVDRRQPEKVVPTGFDKMLAASYASLGVSPEQQAKLNALAGRTGMPVAAVRENEADIGALLLARDNARSSQDFPQLQEHISNPQVYPAVRDDVPNLVKLNGKLVQFNKPTGEVRALEKSTARELGDSFARGWRQAGTATYLALNDGLDAARKKLGVKGVSWQEQKAAANPYYDAAIARAVWYRGQQRELAKYQASGWLNDDLAAFARVNESGSFGDNAKFILKHPGMVANTSAESLGRLSGKMPIIGTAFAVNPVAGGIATGLSSAEMEYSATYVDELEKRADAVRRGDETDALATAFGADDWQAAARRKGAVRGLVIGAVDGLTAGLAGRQLLAARGRGLARGAAALTGELALQAGGGMAGELGAQLATEDKIRWGDVQIEGAAEVFMSGHEMAGNMRTLARSQRALADAAAAREIDAAAQETKLAQRDPAGFADLVHTLSPEGLNYYLDADVLHQSGLAERAAQVSPSIAAQYEAALASGGAIQIPQAEWVSLIAPDKELADGLNGITRFDADGMSLAEQQAFVDEGEQLRLQQEAQQEAQQAQERQQERLALEEDVARQLNDVGQFDDAANRAYAALVSGFVATQAQRLGLSVPEMWAQHRLNIVGDTVQGETLEQALKSNPPNGWVHSENGVDAAALWNGTSKAQAVFWTDLQGRFAQDLPHFANYSVSVSRSAVEHIKKNHGNPETEAARGQIAMTDADVSRIPQVVQNYDDMRAMNIPGTNNQRIAFAKAFDDGVMVFLADSSKKRRDLRTVSAWKYPQSANAHDVLNYAVSLPLTSETEGGMSHGENITAAHAKNQDTLYQNAAEDAERQQQLAETAEAADSLLHQDTHRGSFSPSTNTIALLKNADLSTFIHELGHYFLQAQLNIALSLQEKQAAGMALSEGEAAQLADVQKLLDWFGLESLQAWQDLGFEGQREYHEQLARGFEAYAMEGKAPNLALREIFRRMKAWLLRVYQSLRSLNVELTDEVRGVFDRWLATDAEIDVSLRDANMSLLFEDAAAAGMSEREYADYQALGEQAASEAREWLADKAVADLQYGRNAQNRHLKKLQKEAESLRRSLAAEVSAEMAALPVYRAWRLLTAENGLRLDGENLAALGLSADQLALLEARGMVSAQGVPADVAADMVLDDEGNALFSSGEEMVQQLLAASPQEEAAAAATDDLLLQRYGDLTSPEALAAAADEAAYNDIRLRVLSREYNALARAVGGRRLLAQAAKAAAREALGRMRLKNISAARYRRQASKAARQAELALKKGDLAAAAAAKRRQILQAALAQQAAQMESRAAQVRRQWGKWANRARKKSAKTHEAQLAEVVRAVVGMYGISPKKGADAAAYLDVAEQYQAENAPQVREIMSRASMDMRQDGAHKLFADLSFDEMQALHTELLSLLLQAKRERQVRIDGKLKSREQIAQALREELLRAKPQDVDMSRAVSKGERAKWNLQSLVYSATRVETWAETLGKGFTDYVFRPVKQGAEAYRKQAAQMKMRFKELLVPIQQDFKTGQIEAPELGYTFSGMNELLHALLHSGNRSNLRKLLLGRGWAQDTPQGLDTSRWQAFLDRMHEQGVLAERHWQFAQGVWDLMEDGKKSAQAAHYEVFGYHFDEVTADALQTPWGEFRGGYVPAQVDAELVPDAQLRDLANAENESMEFSFPSTNRGFTRSRVEYNRPLALDLGRLMGHMEQVALFSHMEVPVRDVRRILGDISVELNRRQRGAMDAMLLPWLNRAAQQRAVTKGKADGGYSRFLSMLRSRAGMALMFANVVNTLQQITGFALANVKVKSRYLLAATGDFLANRKAMQESVAARSEFMRSRMENEIAAMSDFIQETLVNPNALQKAQNWTNRNAYFLQQAMANQMEPIIWTAAYRQGLAEGMSEADAAFFADSTIRQTQGSVLPEDISRVETGHAFIRLFTQFMGYFNMQANLLGGGLVKILRQGGIAQNKTAAAHLFMMAYFIPAAVAELIAAVGYGLKDDDDDGYGDDIAKVMLVDGPVKNLLAMIPLAGQVGTYAWNKYDGRYGSKLGNAPGVGMVESMVNVPFSLAKAADADASYRDKRKAVYDSATLATMMLGLPVRGAVKATEQADDWSGAHLLTEE